MVGGFIDGGLLLVDGGEVLHARVFESMINFKIAFVRSGGGCHCQG